MDHGIAVSLSGFKVQDATLQQLALSSKYPLFKIALTGTGSLTIPAADGSGNPGMSSTNIAHGLSYIPMFRVYGLGGLGQTNRIPLDYEIFDGASGIWFEARCDITNLIIQGQNASLSAHTLPFYYYIFADGGV